MVRGYDLDRLFSTDIDDRSLNDLLKVLENNGIRTKDESGKIRHTTDVFDALCSMLKHVGYTTTDGVSYIEAIDAFLNYQLENSEINDVGVADSLDTFLSTFKICITEQEVIQNQ